MYLLPSVGPVHLLLFEMHVCKPMCSLLEVGQATRADALWPRRKGLGLSGWLYFLVLWDNWHFWNTMTLFAHCV